MEKVVLTIVAASGLCVFLSHAERRFYFIREHRNITGALSYCREKYRDLATVDSQEDMDALTAVAYAAQTNGTDLGAWIGLYNAVNSWRWSMSNTSFYRPNQDQLRNWSPGEPNNYNGRESCAVMYASGLWNDEDCEAVFQGICSDVRGSTVTFVTTSTAMTWSQAQSFCRTYYTDLASVRNMLENQNVALQVPSAGKAWIGLFRDLWMWFDGSKSSYRFWKTSEPNNLNNQESCVAANFSVFGQWEDVKCGDSRAFVCYSAVMKRVVRMRLVKQSSSPDPNDAAVMENIMKQLKQKLQDNGVKEDVELSWRKQPDGKVFHEDDDSRERSEE